MAKAKLDGVGVAHPDQQATPRLQMLMTEAESAPVSTSISWTRASHERSAAQRLDRISVAAFYLAEARGFVPGHEADDWLLAQAQVDATDAGVE
jgi:hypothetical protein